LNEQTDRQWDEGAGGEHYTSGQYIHWRTDKKAARWFMSVTS